MWLAAVVYIVIWNKYAKFEVNIFDGIKDIGISILLTNADTDPSAI